MVFFSVVPLNYHIKPLTKIGKLMSKVSLDATIYILPRYKISANGFYIPSTSGIWYYWRCHFGIGFNINKTFFLVSESSFTTFFFTYLTVAQTFLGAHISISCCMTATLRQLDFATDNSLEGSLKGNYCRDVTFSQNCHHLLPILDTWL